MRPFARVDTAAAAPEARGAEADGGDVAAAEPATAAGGAARAEIEVAAALTEEPACDGDSG
jgi:hypothetical protein